MQYSLPLPQGKLWIGNYLVKYNRVKSDWVRNSRVIYDPVRNKPVRNERFRNDSVTYIRMHINTVNFSFQQVFIDLTNTTKPPGTKFQLILKKFL